MRQKIALRGLSKEVAADHYKVLQRALARLFGVDGWRVVILAIRRTSIARRRLGADSNEAVSLDYEIKFYEHEISAASEIIKVEAKQKQLAESDTNLTSALASDIQNSMAEEGVSVGVVNVAQATEPEQEAFDDSSESEDKSGDGDESPPVKGKGSSAFNNILNLLKEHGVLIAIVAGGLLIFTVMGLFVCSRGRASDSQQPLPAKGSGPAIRLDIEMSNRPLATSVSFATNPMAKPVAAGALVVLNPKMR